MITEATTRFCSLLDLLGQSSCLLGIQATYRLEAQCMSGLPSTPAVTSVYVYLPSLRALLWIIFMWYQWRRLPGSCGTEKNRHRRHHEVISY